MSTVIDFEAFRKNYLVIGLTPDQIKDIAGLAQLRRFVAQDFLIKSGHQGADMYVVLSGRVVVTMPDGNKLADVGPGSVLGEIALIDAQPRSADAICVGLVEAAVFDANALRGYLNTHREMGFVVMINLARVLCGRLRDANTKIDMLTDLTTDGWKNAL